MGRKKQEAEDNDREDRQRSCSRAVSDRFENLNIIKMRQSWNLGFNGKESESADDLLDRLDDCRQAASIINTELLIASPSILRKDADR